VTRARRSRMPDTDVTGECARVVHADGAAKCARLAADALLPARGRAIAACSDTPLPARARAAFVAGTDAVPCGWRTGVKRAEGACCRGRAHGQSRSSSELSSGPPTMLRTLADLERARQHHARHRDGRERRRSCPRRSVVEG
jgi:hypothetical protein